MDGQIDLAALPLGEGGEEEIILQIAAGFSQALAVGRLARLEPRGGLAGLLHSSVRELMEIEGIGQVKAVQLQCIGELARRISRSSTRKDLQIDTPSSIARYFMEDMRHLETEEVVAAFFDTKGGLITSRVISRGTVNMSLVSPREIFIEALREQAVEMVLLHNHPSGDPHPSREDFLMTRRLYHCGQLLGIALLDHIIIGDQCYVSFQENGYFSDFPDGENDQL